MADAKISQLPVATTPLDGTELVPIVQSSTTKQATVNNILTAGLPVSASTLAASGNVTLGDASTDTVQVNGYMGVGGAANSAVGIIATPSALSGATQYGIFSAPTATSAATSGVSGLYAKASTAAASFTTASLRGIYVADSTKGAGSTITDQHGILIVDQTAGTNNYGITSAVSSGANKWNIYASGTAANYFAGSVGIGTNVPGASLHAVGSPPARFDKSSDAAEPNLRFRTVKDSYATQWAVGQASLSIDFGVSYFNGSTWAAHLRITSVGNVSIGGTADRATTVGSAALNIFNGTAPVGTLTNGISIYSSAGEAYVMDAAGNATLFSPHDAETNEWIFKSKHTPTGKVLKIDVERLLRFVNDHFGLDAVQEFIED